MARVQLEQLRTYGIVGVHAWERKRARLLLVDITLELADDSSVQNDKLENTVDYFATAQAVTEIVATLKPQLIEHLAGKIHDYLISLAGVESAEVTVSKPHAVLSAGNVSVTVG